MVYERENEGFDVDVYVWKSESESPLRLEQRESLDS